MAKLGDIGKIITGNTPKTSESDNYSSNDIAFIKPSDIPENEIAILSDAEFYISESAREKARILPPGSILVTCIGIIGKVAITDIECAFNQQINAIIPYMDKCNPQYVAYTIQYLKPQLQTIANAAVVPILNKSQFSDIEIPLPPLDEQRRIAAVLDKVSDLIAKRREQLRKLDELVKARFVEMFEHVSDQVLLSDVAEVTGGLTKNSKRKDFPIKLPYLRVANVFFDTIDTNEILEIGLTEEEKRKTLLQNGDLLFVEGNGNPEQIGRVAVWQDEIVPCVHQNHLIKARFNLAKMLPTYAMNYFMTQKGREQIREKAVSTSGLYTLSVSKIESLHIPFAPMDRQLQFTDFKEKVDKSKLTIRQSLNKLETLKKALMQQYFG